MTITKKMRHSALMVGLAGALFFGGMTFGAAPSHATHNWCEQTGDDVYVYPADAGADLGLSPLAFWFVCVGNTSVGVETSVEGVNGTNTSVTVWYCPSRDSCFPLVGETGLVPSTLGGHDVYVNGQKIARIPV